MTPELSSLRQDSPLVSVIIPCYQQGRFLADAIESVYAQTHTNHEIIIVDDGSTDETCEVARRFPQARYFPKPNGGAATARNYGARESHGDFLIFLDADDRILPQGIEIGLRAFAGHPDCVMTFGASRRIDHLGDPLPTFWRHLVRDDYYLAFLRRSYIYNPASAMFRRSVFDSGAIFDEALRICSDYAFYLQVARRWPVYCHNEVVSEYRQHSQQQTRNRRRMTEATVQIIEAQEPFIRQSHSYRKMAAKGSRLCRHAYSHYLLTAAWKTFRGGDWTEARQILGEFFRYDAPLAAYVVPWAILRACRHQLAGVKPRSADALDDSLPAVE